MILRPAFAAEAPLLAELHAEAFAADERWGADALALMLEAAGGFGLLALDGSPPFGDAALGFALARAAGGEAEILTLAVRPASRRGGVGRRLLAGLLEGAAARGAAVLFLEVAASNAPAQALYAGAGATEVGRRRRYYPDGGDALVLRLEIS